ncbi:MULTISPECIES: TetR/AcrR family transcriptional regulator [Actinoalloteichus]|uniref:Transcriptional regulator, TetR family n=1 Tax=Actinoalloteichus fjordicus TaxID=1612552 RepID=A0AAC9LDY6_9PSEU|nr:MULTISPECIES: TetR family transcriptional regulator [Actinoalloteichus]APU15114.1 transcriptional regulator, TetR family [Actinoalloteichus fjordicus]APU21182.1 transcriptional regulator, TetR family [Actinoalloteichus sp. GBA129-24]
MRQNPARRAALLDGAIEVLAREGSRGLTQRAVDKEAAVPIGTASNYFRDRDDLLVQAGARVYERLRPEDAELTEAFDRVRDVASYTAMVREAVARSAAFRSGYLALLELRLEATRRPELRTLLTERVRADLDENVTLHEAAGLPGDATAVRLVFLAMNWLVVEQLTLPDVLTEDQRDELITQAVARIVVPPPAGTT